MGWNGVLELRGHAGCDLEGGVARKAASTCAPQSADCSRPRLFSKLVLRFNIASTRDAAWSPNLNAF
jgi:hypothetical protein